MVRAVAVLVVILMVYKVRIRFFLVVYSVRISLLLLLLVGDNKRL